MDDLTFLTIGMVLDYFEDYAEAKAPKEKREPMIRKATQADFDRF